MKIRFNGAIDRFDFGTTASGSRGLKVIDYKSGSKNISRLRRVTGYLTGDYKTAVNYGKQEEVKDRVKHIEHF